MTNEEMFAKILERLNGIAADVAETKAMVRGAIAVQDQIADALMSLGIDIAAPHATGEPVDAPDDVSTLLGRFLKKPPPTGL